MGQRHGHGLYRYDTVSTAAQAIATLLFALGGFLLFARMGLIVPALLNDTPPYGLECYSTPVIQVMDLGLILPLALLAAVLLLKRRSYGYLLATVTLTKGFTMLVAVSAMALGQVLAGVPVSSLEVVVFPAFALLNAGMTWLLLRSVSGRAAAVNPGSR